jgi:hypothetical protein
MFFIGRDYPSASILAIFGINHPAHPR